MIADMLASPGVVWAVSRAGLPVLLGRNRPTPASLGRGSAPTYLMRRA